MRFEGIQTRRWFTIAAGIAAIILLALVWIRVPKTIPYEVIEIPQPAGCLRIDDMVINDMGIVAGTLKRGRNESDHVFLWDQEHGLRDGCPGFARDPTMILVADINNRGQIVGFYGLKVLDEDGRFTEIEISKGFLYDPQSGFQSIGDRKGFREVWLRSINENGLVLGEWWRYRPDGKEESRIFFWDPETGIWDPNLVGCGVEINTFGHLIGWNGEGHFIWSPEEGYKPLGDSAYGPVAACTLTDSDEVLGFTGNPDSKVGMKLWRWDRDEGYRYFTGLGTIGYPIYCMNDRKFLYFEHLKPFNWFGWRQNIQEGDYVRIYTPGKGLTIPLNLPENKFPNQDFWTINRKGWIVGANDPNVYVMIPKGKRGK